MKMLRFALPILLFLFIQALYGAVDLWAVGRFATHDDVSAVATGSHFMSLITGFLTGLAMGTTAELAEKFTKGDIYSSGYVAGASIRVFVIVGAVIGVLLFTLAPVIAVVLNTPNEALDKTIIYLRICGIGSIAIAMFNLINAIFQALGDSKTPLLFVLVACVFNVFLDFMLVKVFNLGTVGVAVATVVSQTMSVISSIIYIHKWHFPFRFTREQVDAHKGYGRKILRTGIPVGFQQVFIHCYYIVILGFANTLGMVASAGVGIAERIVMFIMLIPLTFMETLTVFVAQNVAKGDRKAVKKCLTLGIIWSICIGVVIFGVLEFYGDSIIRIFISDKEIVNASYEFLKATAIECLVLSVVYCILGYMNGTKHTLFVMVQGAVAILGVKIPYAYYAVFKTTPNLFNLGLSLEYASMFQLALCVFYFLICCKDENY